MNMSSLILFSLLSFRKRSEGKKKHELRSFSRLMNNITQGADADCCMGQSCQTRFLGRWVCFLLRERESWQGGQCGANTQAEILDWLHRCISTVLFYHKHRKE
ncbi:Hypothetical predicted protein [Podarcis lilfordi]|uniref:Uncharacterized protein n=1 Tax=Podarcis lilfordi TaxID=74358 RepID=A0AA35JWA7_9SAUR|nr:Hypothetical predicted protein [Podarcis lilfordi]